MNRPLPFAVCLFCALAVLGCSGDRAAVDSPDDATHPVQLVQANAEGAGDESLFDKFADLARSSSLPEVPDDGQPEGAVPPEVFPPDPLGPAALGDEDNLIEFFQSQAWADIKAKSLRDLALANRQARVRDCQNINVMLIVIDDLGYGDVGVYGQERIKTPNIDQLAQTGIRFTDYYAGSSVGMPSHCTLLTGLHSGHCRLRGNREDAFLPTGDPTLADMMFMAGFETAMFGSWKLGDGNTPSKPVDQGFRESYGYLNPTHARNYYPNYLWRNDQREPIPGNQNNAREHYSLDLVTDETVDYLTRGRRRPFFVMVSLAPPRGNLDDVPSLEPYSGEDWPREQKQYAAMITRVDDAVGRIIDELYRRNMKENTIVILTSDNGPHKEGVNPEFFNSNGPFNGIKASLQEGGTRVPMIVWGPSDIIRAAGGVNHYVWWAPDVMPTILDLVGAWRTPQYTDGMSQVPLWEGRIPPPHHHLYWELYEDGFKQAVRMDDWKAIRVGLRGPVKLFDLQEDPGEETDVAQSHPEVVREIAQIMEEEHRDSPGWPVPAQ